MKKRTISDVLAMESFSAVEDSEKISRMIRIRRRNFDIANEGLFDFFKKSKQGTKENENWATKTVDQHYEELINSDEVSIHLKTSSVEEEIKYFQELLNKGIPLLFNDIKRIEKCLKFIISNGQSTVDKLDGLVDISYPDNSYNLDLKSKSCVFSTFHITMDWLAENKESQKNIGVSSSILQLDKNRQFISKFGSNLTQEEIKRYEKMYFLNEAIPALDMVVPLKRANPGQKRVYLSKGDHKLETLIKLNTEIINKCISVFGEYGEYQTELNKLTNKAIEKSEPIDIGTDFGLYELFMNSMGYINDLDSGFKEYFLKYYTAH